jgi:nucleoside-diphosphate-sugar epimerase
MIVVIGASSNIGRHIAARLLDRGHAVRLLARDPSRLDGRAERVAGTASMVGRVSHDADAVISVAHARHTAEILATLPESVRTLILTGSAWRYSEVPNILADEVREAEKAFLASGRNGVMLHPTMIYGGSQERNLDLIFAALRRLPVFPLPGGGRNLIQPIHVDDLAACFVAAVTRTWDGPNLITVAGPEPIEWRKMVEACAESLGLRRRIVPFPLAPAIYALKAMERLGLKLPIESGMLQRFRENADYSIARMQAELGITPRPFDLRGEPTGQH